MLDVADPAFAQWLRALRVDQPGISPGTALIVVRTVFQRLARDPALAGVMESPLKRVSTNRPVLRFS
jgi:hypothetical protein